MDNYGEKQDFFHRAAVVRDIAAAGVTAFTFQCALCTLSGGQGHPKDVQA